MKSIDIDKLTKSELKKLLKKKKSEEDQIKG
jgi:hypothetical protein